MEEAADQDGPVFQIPLKGDDVKCSAFSPDSTWLAASGVTGRVDIYRVSDGGLGYSLEKRGQKRWPCTTMSFRPHSTCFSSMNILVICDVGGNIHHWHATSGKHLGSIKEDKNDIHTVDFQPTAEKFATAGSDFKVRVYDEATRRLLSCLWEGDGITVAGHTNRVFAVRWHPEDPFVIFSGGWDNTVQIWDLRIGRSVRSVFGPKLCGESLDISDNKILTGSWRSTDQLQEWDFGSGELLRTFEWMNHKEASHVYTAQYGKGLSHKYIVAGGSKSNGACLFHRDTGKAIAGFWGQDKAVYSTCFSETGKFLAVTGANDLYLYDMVDLASSMYEKT